MSKAVVIGAGPVGLAAAMLLAKHDVDVVVLDRDQAAPGTLDEAWDTWERRSVTQFRQVHFLQPRGRALLEEHLPAVVEQLIANGAVRFNVIEDLAKCLPDGPGDLDYSKFVTYTTCRRPIIESAYLAAARAMPSIEIRNQAIVSALLTGASVIPGVPHVTGVRLDNGDEIEADVVIDAGGRRTPVPAMIDAAGGRKPAERAEDLGFVYATRYYQGDSLPEVRGDLLAAVGSISILTMPGDHGHWSVTLYSSPHDKEMRAVRDPATFDRVVRAMPRHAHWVDGTAVTDVATMTSTANTVREFMVDGTPCATGLLPAGDAWGFTNPSLGRGMTLGLMQAIATADAIANHGADPVAMAKEWQRATEEVCVPWHDATVQFDRVRGPEVEAIRMREPDPHDPNDMMVAGSRALDSARHYDAEVLHNFGDAMCCFALPMELMGRPGVFDKVLEVAMSNPPYATPGPDRDQLEELLAG